MEQRPLRLGDILDDYCPRERRVTNHAVVAMIEEDVKQTRCTTCDAEHVYKGGKAPRRKKSDSTGALYKEVLAGMTDQEAAPPRALPIEEPAPTIHTVAAAIVADDPTDIAESEIMADREDDDDMQPADMPEDTAPPLGDEGPVHRPLIRAQLPRVEGLKVERQAPDFTIRQNNVRGGGSFRGAGSRNNGGGAGNGNSGRFGRGPQRGGGRGGSSHGFGRGPGGGNQPRHGGGAPRKRGR
jgi:hypothetical protein